MLIRSLTNRVYTKWGARYSEFNWRPEWYTFLRIANREENTYEFHEYFKQKFCVNHIIYWFDTNVLQKIGVKNETFTCKDGKYISTKCTTDVAIRIVCGMVNKNTTLTRDQKIAFVECMWDIYRKMYYDWYQYYNKYILQLPF